MTAQEENERREAFAEERSHRDSVAAADTLRATAQSAILINGGAATALIAYLSKEDSAKVLLTTASCSLVGYALGVLFASVMLFWMIKSMHFSAVTWMERAYPKVSGNRRENFAETICFRLWTAAQLCFAASMICFVVSSVLMATTLARH